MQFFEQTSFNCCGVVTVFSLFFTLRLFDVLFCTMYVVTEVLVLVFFSFLFTFHSRHVEGVFAF